jgi:hypothetical protein
VFDGLASAALGDTMVVVWKGSVTPERTWWSACALVAAVTAQYQALDVRMG